MASTIVSSTTISSPTGLANQKHIIYAVNSARWWLFYWSSTTVLATQYSSDGSTWTTGPTLTVQTGNTANSDGRDLSVFYKNISSNDVVAVVWNAGAKPLVTRGLISGTSITWATEVSLFTGATQSEPYGGNVIYDSANKLIGATQDGGDPSAYRDANAEAGSGAHTFNMSHTGFIGTTNVSGNDHNMAMMPLSTSGAFLGIFGNSAGASDQDTQIFFNKYSGTAFGGETSIGFSAATTNWNDWGACLRTDTDAHIVRRTGSNTYVHRRWNGTSFSAGDTIPTQTSVANSGPVVVTDGTSVWLFIIDSAAGNAVRVCQWQSGTGWGSWADVEATSATRNWLSVSQTMDSGNNWLVIWSDGSTSPFAIKGALFNVSSTTPITVPSDSGAGTDAIVSIGILLPSDSGAGSDADPSIFATLSPADSGAGTDGTPSISATLSVADSGAGTDAIASIIHVLPADSGTGTDNAPAISATLAVAETGTGTDADPAISATLSVADSGTGTAGTPSILATLSVADSGTGTDAVSVFVVFTVPADAGAGADADPSIFATTTIADTGAGSDALGSIILTLPGDSGTGTDATSVFATLNVADSGAGTDAVSLFIAFTIAETGAETDNISVNQGTNPQVSDAGAGADNVAISATLSVPTDSGTGTDALSALSASLSVPTQTGTGTDAVALGTVSVPVPTDTGAGADAAPSIFNVFSAFADSGLGTDGISVSVTLAIPAEHGTGSDALAFAVVAISTSDSGAGSDDISVAQPNIIPITLPLDVGHGTDHVLVVVVVYAHATFATRDGTSEFATRDGKAALVAV